MQIFEVELGLTAHGGDIILNLQNLYPLLHLANFGKQSLDIGHGQIVSDPGGRNFYAPFR